MMLILLSPAKLQQFDRPLFSKKQPPQFLETSRKIAGFFAEKPVAEIAQLMKISEDKALEVIQQFKSFSASDLRSAGISVYNGPAFSSLNPFDFSPEELLRCQRQLIILSGLFGIVHADTEIVPYRLEMGLPGELLSHKNLYALWKPLISSYLESYCRENELSCVVNCASGEYFKAVDSKALSVPVITVDFREMKAGKAVSVSAFAKQARGSMARWIIQNNPKSTEALKTFDSNGYRYSVELSSEKLFCFVR